MLSYIRLLRASKFNCLVSYLIHYLSICSKLLKFYHCFSAYFSLPQCYGEAMSEKKAIKEVCWNITKLNIIRAAYILKTFSAHFSPRIAQAATQKASIKVVAKVPTMIFLGFNPKVQITDSHWLHLSREKSISKLFQHCHVAPVSAVHHHISCTSSNIWNKKKKCSFINVSLDGYAKLHQKKQRLEWNPTQSKNYDITCFIFAARAQGWSTTFNIVFSMKLCITAKQNINKRVSFY